MIVVMMFALVFLGLGAALFVLIRTSQTGTELERKEVKAFNVAEAGVDAGMLALKLDWPVSSTSPPVDVQSSLIKSELQATNPGLYDPSRSDPSQFIDVVVYDNVDSSGATTTVAYPDAPEWDSNGDGRMFVDSRANVDDDRHRILILAERHTWEFSIPGRALFADWAGANGQGLRVYMDPLSPPPPGPVLASWGTEFGKGVETGPGITRDPNTSDTFDEIMPPAYINALMAIAQNQSTYFTTGAAASSFLTSGNASGAIVYVKSNSALTISGNSQMGSRTQPIVLIIDTPPGTDNNIDWRGTADFYGVVIVLGNALLRGTSTIWGACLCSGLMEGKGAGSTPEIAFNQALLNLVNHQYVMSVNIVPNTWEEYTISPDAEN